MTQFIELTSEDGKPILISLDSVVYIREINFDNCKTKIRLNGYDSIFIDVREDYYDVINLIHGSRFAAVRLNNDLNKFK